MNPSLPGSNRLMFIASIAIMLVSLTFSAFSVTTVLAERQASPSSVTVPSRVGFEGYLNGVADGEHSLEFRVYDAATNGNLKWSETHAAAQVTSGLYTVTLGETSAFDSATFNGDRWIGVKVDGGTELTPRTRISSVPFALNAANANTVANLSVAASGANEHVLASDQYGNVTVSGQLVSQQAAGAAPLAVSSNTMVANLNADLVDGQQATDLLGPKMVILRLADTHSTYCCSWSQNPSLIRFTPSKLAQNATAIYFRVSLNANGNNGGYARFLLNGTSLSVLGNSSVYGPSPQIFTSANLLSSFTDTSDVVAAVELQGGWETFIGMYLAWLEIQY